MARPGPRGGMAPDRPGPAKHGGKLTILGGQSVHCSAELSRSLKVLDRGRNAPKPAQKRSESLCAGLWAPCRVFWDWFGPALGPNPDRNRRFPAGSLNVFEEDRPPRGHDESYNNSAELSRSLKVSDRRRNTPKSGQNRSESLCAGLWVPCRIFWAWFGPALGPNPARNRIFPAGSLKVVGALLAQPRGGERLCTVSGRIRVVAAGEGEGQGQVEGRASL